MSPAKPRLARWSGFAALLAMAGLPIYINAPKVYADQYGLNLAALGGALFLLRLVDVVQDPFPGWLAQATARHRGLTVWAAIALMSVGMIALFAMTPPIAPLAWFALTLAGVFSGYSFLTIVFYAQGVARAESMGEGGHLRLAVWRESGALLGVCVAAVLPVALSTWLAHPHALFAGFFAGFAVLAGWSMRREWRLGWQGRTGPIAGSVGGGDGGGSDPVAGDVRARPVAHRSPRRRGVRAVGFAPWGFVAKATLAMAALVVLPLLQWSGFSGPDSPPQALAVLGLVYAGLPCLLKLAAMSLLAATDLQGVPAHV